MSKARLSNIILVWVAFVVGTFITDSANIERERQSTKHHQMWLLRKHTEAVANGSLAAANASREEQEGELALDPDAFRRYSQCIFKNLHKKGERCRPGTLWGKVVDPLQYEFGCKEIEEMHEGNMTFAGEGAARTVYLVEYRGRDVAVKKLKGATGTYNIFKHWMETVALDTVRGHPNIVNMLGSCNTTVVTEAYPMNLEEYVSASPEALPIRTVVSISLDAARSVQALHEAVEAPIVHFDIKPSQLLMADNGSVKLNDFNLAWIMSTGSDGSPCLFTTKPWVTEGPWRPPEFRSAQPMTEKVDIFSLGFVYFSLISGGLPFREDIVGIPDLDPTWHLGYTELIRSMWLEPVLRPSARQVASRLEGMLEELPPPPP